MCHGWPGYNLILIILLHTSQESGISAEFDASCSASEYLDVIYNSAQSVTDFMNPSAYRSIWTTIN